MQGTGYAAPRHTHTHTSGTAAKCGDSSSISGQSVLDLWAKRPRDGIFSDVFTFPPVIIITTNAPYFFVRLPSNVACSKQVTATLNNVQTTRTCILSRCFRMLEARAAPTDDIKKNHGANGYNYCLKRTFLEIAFLG